MASYSWPAALRLSVLGCALLILNGCGPDSPDAATPTPAPAPQTTPSYTIGGSIAGLTASGLTLANGSDVLTVSSGATKFTLPTAVSSGTNYSVSVQTQPSGEVCSVSAGSGTATAAVTSVAVTCVAATHTLGGSISGLTGTGLVLANGNDTIVVSNGASAFVFAKPVAEGAAYAVTVQTLPSGQNCSITGGSGTMGTGNINSIQVTCSAAAAKASWHTTQVAAGQYPYVARDPSSSAMFLAFSDSDATQPIRASRFTDAAGWSKPVSIAPHGVAYGMGFDLQGNGFATFSFDQNTVGFTRYTPSAGWTSGGPAVPLPAGPPQVIPPGDAVIYARTQPFGLAVFGDGSADSLVLNQFDLNGPGGPNNSLIYSHAIAVPGGDALIMDAVDTALPPSVAQLLPVHVLNPNGSVDVEYIDPVNVGTPIFPMTQAQTTKFHAVLFEEVDATLDPATDFTENPKITTIFRYGVGMWDGQGSASRQYLTAAHDLSTEITKNGIALSDNGSGLFSWAVTQANGSVNVYAQRYDGANWGLPQLLYNDPLPAQNIFSQSLPVSALNASGDGFIFFAVLNGTMAVKVDGKTGSFAAPVLLAAEGSPQAEGVCMMALMDNSGTAYLMDFSPNAGIRLRRLPAGGATFDKDGVEAAIVNAEEGFFSMSLDRDGFPMAAWQYQKDIFTARYH